MTRYECGVFYQNFTICPVVPYWKIQSLQMEFLHFFLTEVQQKVGLSYLKLVTKNLRPAAVSFGHCNLSMIPVSKDSIKDIYF